MDLQSRFIRMLCACALVGIALMIDGVQRPAAPGPAQALASAEAAVDVSQLRRVAQGLIPMPEGAKAAHASSLLVMPQDQAAALTVFWFSGERESGPRVQIVASQMDRQTQRWSPPHVVADRHVLAARLGYGLRRLGNPVAWLDAEGRVHLFVVATGWGGWAASRILHLKQQRSLSHDAAVAEVPAFEPVQVLPLSWLWNTSHLVRNAPLPLHDGGMVLPVHFELGLKYPAVLRMDDQGRFMGMERVSSRTHLLQPTLLAQSPQQWLALMRDERPQGKVGAAVTQDGGLHWQDLPDLVLDNPDASVSGMVMASGQMLLVHNSSVGTRAKLDLSISGDGKNWSLLSTLAHGAPVDEFSYPSMAWADGSLWISYTVDREHLAWQQFAVPKEPVIPKQQGKSP